MLGLLEQIFPSPIQNLYASGITRETLSRSLNGTVAACAVLALTGVMLFALHKPIAAFIKRTNGLRLFTVVLVIITALSLPDPVFPMRPGLDYSWQWMINKLAFTHEWGTSAVFTYGPIGWALYPSSRWITVLMTLVLNVCFCILWIWSLRRIYTSSEHGKSMAWGLVMTMFFPQASMEWRWTALAIVLTRTSWLAAGIVSGFLAMMKFSSILIVSATQIFILVADRRRKPFLYAVGFAVTFVLLAACFFSSPSDFLAWLVGSMQIALGYNHYMILEKNPFLLATPIVVFLVLVHRPRHFWAIIPIAPLLFCSAKYFWVRQGLGPFLYALTVTAAFLMDRFVALRQRFAFASLMFILFGFGLTWPTYFAFGKSYIAFPFGIHPLGLMRSLTLSTSMSTANARSQTMLKGTQLPINIRSLIGESTVQLLPHEFAPAMADTTLNIIPYATIQMYSTYTSYLDALAASSYGTTKAPEYIVIDSMNLSIDDKNPFLDSPRTWSAIKSNYLLCTVSDNKRWILLKRRQAPITITPSKRISVEKETAASKLVSFFFRDKMQYANIESKDGITQTFRVNPLVLNEPIDADLPLDAKDLPNYFSTAL